MPPLAALLKSRFALGASCRRKLARRSASPTQPGHRRLLCEALEQRRLLSIGCPAELPTPHFQAREPDPLDGQIVYLDFDGEENVTYEGPVTVDPLQLPPFAAPRELAGQSAWAK